MAAPKQKSPPKKRAQKIKSPKKKAPKKDPNMPKKVKNSYMIYCNMERENVKAKNPSAKFGDIAKILGKNWREATADIKKKYEELAQADKERYNKECADYANKHVEGEGSEDNEDDDQEGDEDDE